MRIVIDINCDGYALQDGEREPGEGIDEIELHRILCTVPPKVTAQLERTLSCICEAPETADKLLDTNGNTVGLLQVLR